jgi:hypothetical protein
MAGSSNKNKPKIEHIINTGVNERGEIQKNQRIAIRKADNILNSPTNYSKPRKRN